MSDLHLEGGSWAPSPCDAALVLLAGDIDQGVGGIAWAADHLAGTPVLYVAGNHEHWGAPSVERSTTDLAAAAARTENVRFLERRELQFHVVDRCLRVLGCTLWTDHAVRGEAAEAGRMGQDDGSGKDCRNIRRQDGTLVTVDDLVEWHRQSRAWLASRLSQAFSGTTIVVSHHAPSLRSLPPRRRDGPRAADAASDLDALIARTQPALWVHGHSHYDADYRIGETRIVSRQRISAENADYQPLIVEI